ncbi:MAG: alpha/beta hydrolase family protein [Elusimicrobiota bacterium]
MKFRAAREWRLGALLSPSGTGAAPAVLMLHGFPGVLKNEDIAAELCRRGLTVFMPYYGGCWGSPGRFSVRGAFDDARTALRLLSRYRQVDARRIGIFGYSLGGWAALRVASEQPLAAVAVLAPAVPHGNESGDARYLRRHAKAVNIASLRGAWEEYAAEARRDRPERYIPLISPAPLLIVQGLKDRLVPPDLTAGLWAHAPQPKKLVAFPDEDHEFQKDRPAVTAMVCGWLESRLRRPAPSRLLSSTAVLQEECLPANHR